MSSRLPMVICRNKGMLESIGRTLEGAWHKPKHEMPKMADDVDDYELDKLPMPEIIDLESWRHSSTDVKLYEFESVYCTI